MGIAFRYVSRELLAVFAVTAVVLLVIALGGRFMGYLQDAALGKHSADALAKIMALRIPEFVQLTFPFSFYLALVLTIARLYADQEMTVLLTSGTVPREIFSWVFASAVVVAAAVYALSTQVTPRANGVLERFLLVESVERQFEAMTPGMFHPLDDGAGVTYSETASNENRELSQVFIADDVRGESVTIWADRGAQYVDAVTGSRFLVLRSGHRYEGVVGRTPYRVVKFSSLSQRIQQRDPSLAAIEIDAQPTAQLRRDDPRSIAELHWRFALPLMTLIAAPIGFVLARVPTRAGRFARIVPAVLAFLAYYFILLVSRNGLAVGRLPNWVGMWPAHAAFLAVGAVLMRRLNRPRGG
jgi:lipopolysaccharide export system permease protein